MKTSLSVIQYSLNLRTRMNPYRSVSADLDAVSVDLDTVSVDLDTVSVDLDTVQLQCLNTHQERCTVCKSAVPDFTSRNVVCVNCNVCVWSRPISYISV